MIVAKTRASMIWGLLVILVTCFKPGLAQKCVAISNCQESSDAAWLDGIFCHSVFSTGGSVLRVNCSWLHYPLSPINDTEYKLHVMWKNYTNCKEFNTNQTSINIVHKSLNPSTIMTIWVSTQTPNKTCVKTKNFSIKPQVNCEAPLIQYAVHSSNLLQIWLKRTAQVRYRESTSDHWHTINATSLSMNISLPETSVSKSFLVQQRCLNKDCFHCKWTQEKNIPHELLEAPDIIVITEKLSPGKQRVTIEWKYVMHTYADGYIVTIQRIPNSCKKNITFKTQSTKVHINLSIAFFNISVAAYNEAGNSTSASAVVHPLTSPELPGKIFATYKNGTVFLTWTPLFHDHFCVIGWGTHYAKMQYKILMEKTENYSIAGPFENMKRYTIMIHLYDAKRCMDSTNETTFGITYFCTEETVPRSPLNVIVKNVTKNEAVIEWEEIPEEDCLGFLLFYKIYCTDISRNITQDITVNSSTPRTYRLGGLISRHEYEIKVAGVTSKGEGASSTPYVFRTHNYANEEFWIIIISTCIGLAITAVTVVSLCAYTLYRTKKWYFPKIPNPKHSHLNKISGETATKMKMVQLLQSQEEDMRYGDTDVEVIETVLMEATLMDFQIQSTKSITPGHYQCQWAPPVQTSPPNYINVNAAGAQTSLQSAPHIS